MTSEVALASSILLLLLTNLLSGKQKLPGPLSCILYLAVLSAAVFAAYALYGQDGDFELMAWGLGKYAHTGRNIDKNEKKQNMEIQ